MTSQRPIDEDEATIGPARWATEMVERESPSPNEAAHSTAPHRRSRGRIGLSWLIVVLCVGSVGGLVGAARLAPMLPAPVAGWLAPATGGVDAAALDALERDLRSSITEANRETAQAANDAAASTASLARIVEDLRVQLADIDVPQAQGATSAAVAASSAALNDLRAEIDELRVALEERTVEGISPHAQALTALEERVSALEDARASDVVIRQRAPGGTLDARRAAVVATALTEIDRAMGLGEPFADALDRLASGAQMAPPPALQAVAAEGVATRGSLLEGFTPAAHDAVTETLAQDGEDGVQSVLARVQARFTGIPNEPEEGDTVPAILSRARHDLLGGRLTEALGEIDALPPVAQEAMAAWTVRARQRRDADAALDDLRATVEDRY